MTLLPQLQARNSLVASSNAMLPWSFAASAFSIAALSSADNPITWNRSFIFLPFLSDGTPRQLERPTTWDARQPPSWRGQRPEPRGAPPQAQCGGDLPPRRSAGSH